MKNTLVKLALFLSLALTSINLQADSPREFLAGNLEKIENGEFVPSELNPNVKYIAIYFSAHWCPPCRKMTPILVKYYNELTPEDKEQVEFVFYSWDNSEGDMEGYMKSYNMTWPTVPYNTNLLKQYNEGRGIPSLVLIDAETGEVVSDSYVDGKYRSPIPVLEELNKLLNK
jgi:nucleoredoxin